MQGNEYQNMAMRFLNPISGASDEMLLIEGVMGMNGEAGEAVDLVKKMLFQGHDLNKQHVAKELGDVMWYVAATAKAIGYTLDEVMQMNIDKLTARYGDGFKADNSINRKAGDV